MAKAAVRHILVKSSIEAERIKGLLAKGDDFGVLAKRFSLCASAKKGGNLGEVRPGQMVKTFDQVVFKKAILTVHGPIKTQFGYHLIEIIYRD